MGSCRRGRRIGTRPRTIGELFAVERPSLKPLPVETFETGRWFTPRVDRFSQITFRTNHDSVPTRFIGRQVRVPLHASELVVLDGRTEIAHHERQLTKSGSRLKLDHYLEALLRKPGALPGATVLEQARAAGQFTPIHEAWWTPACNAHGGAVGTRAPFAGWGKIFTDPKLCAAIVDRLTFGGNILETGTESYRLAHSRELAR